MRRIPLSRTLSKNNCRRVASVLYKPHTQYYIKFFRDIQVFLINFRSIRHLPFVFLSENVSGKERGLPSVRPKDDGRMLSENGYEKCKDRRHKPGARLCSPVGAFISVFLYFCVLYPELRRPSVRSFILSLLTYGPLSARFVCRQFYGILPESTVECFHDIQVAGFEVVHQNQFLFVRFVSIGG